MPASEPGGPAGPFDTEHEARETARHIYDSEPGTGGHGPPVTASCWRTPAPTPG